MSAGPGPSDAVANLSDPLLLWASQTELELAQQLQENPYFPDTGLTADELERIEKLYGAFLDHQLAAGADIVGLLRLTPAAAATTLIARASRLVDPDTFLTEYVVGLGLAPEAAVAEIPVVELCTAAGLRVPDGLQALDVLAVHCGITAAEVPAILEAVDAAVEDHAAGDDGTADVVGDEAVAVALDAITAEIAPLFAAARCHVPSEAERLVRGILQLRAFALQHPTSWLDRDRGALDPQLPALVRDAVVAELRERPVGTVDRAAAVGVATREMCPRLIFDVTRKKVCLRLPEQRVAAGPVAEVNWRVSVDGSTRVFRTGPAWGETTYAEALDIAVRHPVRDITVKDATNQIVWSVDVVDDADPALVFARNGQNLSDKASLHHSELWVIVPQDARLVDVISNTPISLVESVPVSGWEGWLAHRVDVSSAASLQVVRGTAEPSPRQLLRTIDPRQRPRFVHPVDPEPYVRTTSGTPVHAESLIAEFPPTLSGADEIWHLSISGYAGLSAAGDEVAEPEPLEVPAEGGLFPVFDPEAYDAPWVGEYLVRLRGPRNESFRHRYAIVEGMRSEALVEGGSQSVRIPAAGGLSPARLAIGPGEKPFTVAPRPVEVAPTEAGVDFVVSTDEGDSLPLRFAPPRLTFDLPLQGFPTTWRTTRLVIPPRSLDPQRLLRVRGVGGMSSPQVAVRNQHGSPLRTVRMTSEDGGVTWVTPVDKLAAAMTTVASGKIDFEWTDELSDRRISVTLAVIDPIPNATGIRIDAGELVCEGLAADTRRSAAWLWPSTAPWVPARSLDIVGERTPLPADLVDAGPLFVQIYAAEPFDHLWPPLVPTPGAFKADQPGYFAAQSEELAELSAFLGGQRDAAPEGETILPLIWDNLAAWFTTATPAVSGMQAAIHSVLEANPSASLRALSDSLVASPQQPGRIISSGLITVPFSGAVRAEDVHGTPWIGALQILDAFPQLFEDYETKAAAAASPAALGAERKIIRSHVEDLRKVGGDNLVNTLVTGRDTTLDSATIDQSTVRLAGMDQAQQQALLAMFFSNADVVPGRIMDDSSRLAAVMETFEKRAELSALVATEGLIKPAVTLLRTIRSTQRTLYSAARVRFDKLEGVNTEERANAWALAPVISMVFALAARMSAHGLAPKSKTLEAAVQPWAQLADVVPDLVTGDLVAAEAMVIAVKYPGMLQ